MELPWVKRIKRRNIMSKAIQSAYQKMLENPNNRIKTTIKQPTPFDKETPIKESIQDPFQKVGADDPDALMLKEIDRRIAEKKKIGITNEKYQLNEVEKINKRLDTIEETLMNIMKAHVKLMKGLQ